MKLNKNQTAALRFLVEESETWPNRFDPGTLEALQRRGLAVIEEPGFPPRPLAVATDKGRAVYQSMTQRTQTLPSFKPPVRRILDRDAALTQVLGAYYERAGAEIDAWRKHEEAKHGRND